MDLPLRASNGCWFIWSISSIWFGWLIGLEIHPEEPDRPERPANQTDEPERVPRAREHVGVLPVLLSLHIIVRGQTGCLSVHQGLVESAVAER